ncbi:MAG: CpaF family protein [Clostridia bacterium]|jgi:pilus assembly protein CpaF|nr:CpaF family protein [Clostridia bacterium]
MGLLEKLEKQKLKQHNTEVSTESEQKVTKSNPSPFVDEYYELKEKVHAGVIELINHEVANGNDVAENQKEYLLKSIEGLINANSTGISRAERLRIQKEIYNNVVGLGPLEPLLEDPDISEIMVNGPYNVYIERRGKLELSSTVFKDNEQLLNIITRIVSSVGRRIDEASPMVDARLLDGSRVNAVIPPIVLNGPTLTIRKFSKNALKASDLVKKSSLSPMMVSFLEACVRGKLNVIVSGGTGSGKTTLLNILSGFIPDTERIVTIEDAAELQLRQNHVVTMESRAANLEGVGQITIRELVRNALRMRPDRIVVGEVRSGETLDMLQAMNTGHDGSLTTAHANSPRDLMSRLETMVLMSGMELPIKAIREQVSSALDLVVQQARLRDGSRKIINISQVVGMEGDTITLQDLFVFKQKGLDSAGNIIGDFVSTGIRPTFLEKLTSNGVLVKDDWFKR